MTDPGRPLSADAPTDDRPPPVKRRRFKLNHDAYVAARARGASVPEAARLAGSSGTTSAGLRSAGRAIEARPDVSSAIEAERTRIADEIAAEVEADLMAGWRATVKWLRAVAEGTVPATNIDRTAAASLLGRALGTLARKAEIASSSPLPLGTLLRPPVIVEPPPLSAPPATSPTTTSGDGPTTYES